MTPEIKKEYFYDNYYALLAGYAAGTLSEPENIAVACHLTLKPRARSVLTQMEAIAGACLEHDMEPAELSENCLNDVLERLGDRQETRTIPKEEKAAHNTARQEREAESLGFVFPEPLRPYLKDHIQAHELDWKNKASGIECFALDFESGKKVELLRIAPGAGVPAHTHEGEELTLLLDGAFEDEFGVHELGDLIILDERFTHHPVSDAQRGCICFTVSTSPIKMTGPLMRFLNPFLK